MVATEVVSMLVRGSGSLIQQVTEAFSEKDWTQRRIPGTNPPGFTAWHMARTVDWAIQTGVRGEPEIVTEPRFRSLGAEFGIGVGITAEEAMAIAKRMARADVSEYAGAVTTAALGWLAAVDEETLTATNRLKEHQSGIPAYATSGHLSESSDLFGIPNWQLILRPAASHIRVHYGELDLLAQVPPNPD